MCKILNFVAEFYGLKVKNYLNYRGSNLNGGKKFTAYYIANNSNLLLHANIDIILFANRFVFSFNVACEIAIWK